jgi:prepilin-type N-terminal cleavage/methylation domain-containing protein
MKRMNTRGVTLMELLVAITLLSLLSTGILFAIRIGLDAMRKSNDRLMSNRKVVGVDRIISQQIAGFMPARALCSPAPGAAPSVFSFFQGESQTMRFVSSFSLQEASRGYPRILEYQVIPAENNRGVRLIVNEILYTGPFSTGGMCAGVRVDPLAGVPLMIFRPVAVNSASFVLLDKLAGCRMLYKEDRDYPLPDLWHERWARTRTPSAVRIEFSPIEPDPAKLQLPPITVPLHANRDVMLDYKDFNL